MEKERIEAIVREVIEKMTGGQNRECAVYEALGSASAKTATDAADRDVFGRPNETAAGASGWERENALRGSSSCRETATCPPGKLVSANGGKTQVTMPLALAVRLIEKVEAKAAEWDMRVVTAVSDASGRPVAIHCMDGAYIGSFDVALNKTYTSIAFQMSTADLGRLSAPGGSLYGVQFTNGGKIVIFGGGELLLKDGCIAGALGVSGGNAEQDTALAAYGKNVFTELE